MYKTVVHSNAEALQAINALYLKGDMHLDTCFKEGAFYKNSGLFPEIKQDIKPLLPDVLKIDVTKMQHPRNAVRSVMFDPPWLVSGSGRGTGTKTTVKNKMAGQYGSFTSAAEMFAFQDKALFEISRCLIPGGWLVTKVQDCSYGRQKYFLSIYQVNKARELGLDLVDSFILVSKNRMRSATAGRLSAISQHCFFMVFRKGERKKRIVRY